MTLSDLLFALLLIALGLACGAGVNVAMHAVVWR